MNVPLYNGAVPSCINITWGAQ